ncbi:NADP-dependent oxidoreductase [Actinoplanes sp. NBRC 101535]|uniref:NADP-dependent oxidoreductase n=1 Tax=Actinoplanes sp. NBRC 101535 TaxID=3032196 RepID=UPI0024A5DB7F|nr:NADP-dependent oxidoreductase [Actinoplanes sp. NBRC 101535]GLY04534.1 oxidoreductase [Actinoplanes sp. NBRC 101535]
MRALQFSEYGSADVLHVAEVPEPHAGPGRIRIAVRASGVTPADWKVRSGAFQQMIPLPLPHTPGIDAAGVVDEVGEGVTGVAVGDEVFGMADLAAMGGANADHVVLALWAPKPSTLTWEQAGGGAGNTETAVRTLALLGVRAGDVLLIDGAAGGVGSMAVQFAVAAGATVVGTAGPANHEFLAGLGAIPVTYGPGLADRVSALVPKVDAVLDCAGSGSLPELVKLAGGPERVVTIADLSAAEPEVLRSRTGGPGAGPQAVAEFKASVELFEQGRVTVPVAAVFPLSEAADAHRLSETGHLRGKIVLTP